ncbi:MAG: class II aldolase/adducin family protein [Anaerovorax sp.]
MESLTAKKQVVEAGNRLLETGLVARTWGNVSCRIDKETFAITPSGRGYASLDWSHIVEVKIADLSHDESQKPSSEVRIHAELYKLRKDVNFVIHTHQENASAVSAIGFDVIRLDHMYEYIGDEILCAEYALPGTKKLCKNVVKSVLESKGKGVIMKNHGALCFGESLAEAFAVASTLELACSNYIDKKRQRFGDSKAYEDIEGEPIAFHSFKALQTAVGKGKFLVWNQDQEVIRVSKLVSNMKPYVDDFAQIVGVKMLTILDNLPKMKRMAEKNHTFFVFGKGAVCVGNTQADAEAASMIVRKNCKAFLGITLFCKPKPINMAESAFMRLNYLKNYSKKAAE